MVLLSHGNKFLCRAESSCCTNQSFGECLSPKMFAKLTSLVPCHTPLNQQELCRFFLSSLNFYVSCLERRIASMEDQSSIDPSWFSKTMYSRCKMQARHWALLEPKALGARRMLRCVPKYARLTSKKQGNNPIYVVFSFYSCATRFIK